MAAARLCCRRGATTRSLLGHHDRSGDVDTGDPVARRVARQGPAGLGEHAGIVASELLAGPETDLGGLDTALQHPLGDAPSHDARRGTRRPRQAFDATRPRTLGGAATDEVAARRAQHQRRHEVVVAMPQQLGDRTTHRVAHGDELIDPEDVGQHRDVVRAVGEAEAIGRAQAEAVAAMVDREHVETRRECVVRREPVERRARGPAVQQHERRCTLGTGALADERGAAAGELDEAAVGDPGRRRERQLVDVGHVVSPRCRRPRP